MYCLSQLLSPVHTEMMLVTEEDIKTLVSARDQKDFAKSYQVGVVVGTYQSSQLSHNTPIYMYLLV